MMLRFQILFTFAIFINPGLCLICIKCNSNNPMDCYEVEQCPEPSSMYMKHIKKLYFPDSKVDYDNPKNIPKSVCYTSVTTENDGQKKSSRKCSAAGSTLTCEILKMDAKIANINLDECSTCHDDLCNSATNLMYSSLMLIIPSLFLKYW